MNSIELAALIDSARFECRLRELAFFVPAGAEERAHRIAASLERLPAGRYAVGLGPNCSQTIRVGRHPVRLGRHASPLEEPRDEVVDYTVDDASLHGPREVSRVHCTLDPTDCGDDEVAVIDEGSSTGTWIQPLSTRVEPHMRTLLRHGSMFSLGPSGTNLFMVLRIGG
jgi:hypothetical protein